jgi:hypothetical protein
MPRLPAVRPRQVIRALERAGLKSITRRAVTSFSGVLVTAAVWSCPSTVAIWVVG